MSVTDSMKTFYPLPLTAVGLPWVFNITCDSIVSPPRSSVPPEPTLQAPGTRDDLIPWLQTNEGRHKRPNKSVTLQTTRACQQTSSSAALTRLMRIKIRVQNLSNRIKFHLSSSGATAAPCVMAEGFHYKCFSTTVMKNTVSSLIFAGLCHHQLLNPTMSACLLSRNAAWRRSNISGTDLISTERHQRSETQRRDIVSHDERCLTAADGFWYKLAQFNSWIRRVHDHPTFQIRSGNSGHQSWSKLSFNFLGSVEQESECESELLNANLMVCNYQGSPTSCLLWPFGWFFLLPKSTSLQKTAENVCSGNFCLGINNAGRSATASRLQRLRSIQVQLVLLHDDKPAGGCILSVVSSKINLGYIGTQFQDICSLHLCTYGIEKYLRTALFQWSLKDNWKWWFIVSN